LTAGGGGGTPAGGGGGTPAGGGGIPAGGGGGTPAGDAAAPVNDIERATTAAEKAAQEKAAKELQARTWAGIVLGIVGVLGAVVLGVYSFCSLHKLSNEYKTVLTKDTKAPPAATAGIKIPLEGNPSAAAVAPKEDRADAQEWSAAMKVFYVSVGGHAVITIALVWLIYQLLRAAERMVLPRALSNEPEVIRALLGISSPQSELLRLAKEILPLASERKSEE
jgi:hypothetical protein